MQLVVVSFLSILYFATASPPVADSARAADKDPVVSYFCDDGMLRSIDHRLELLAAKQEILSLTLQSSQMRPLKCDEFSDSTTNIGLNQSTLLQELRIDVENSFEKVAQRLIESKKPIEEPCKGSFIDLRSDFVAVDNKPALSVLPSNCAEAVLASGHSGIYKIRIPDSNLKPFFVYCKLDPDGGPAWTVFQRRQNGAVDFYRNWDDYKNGFGNLEREFFLGLDKLHALTSTMIHELWIHMEDFDSVSRSARYSSFAIGDANEAYALNILGNYSGDAGDSLTDHEGQKFSTKDVDNDSYEKNCAQEFSGAWWYNKCHRSNLNGQYLKGSYAKNLFAKGINWYDWHGHYYSLKYTHMAIRPVDHK